MVLVAVAPVIAPDRLRVVAPDNAPALIIRPLMVFTVVAADNVPALIIRPLMVFTVVGAVIAPVTASVPVKLAAEDMVWLFIRPEVIVPMFTRLPPLVIL